MNIAAFRARFRTSPNPAYAFLIAAIAAAYFDGRVVLRIRDQELEPCPLCLQQRIPYYIAIPFALALGFFARDKGRAPLVVYGLYALAALMLFSGVFGTYHAGRGMGLVARTGHMRRQQRKRRGQQPDRGAEGRAGRALRRSAIRRLRHLARGLQRADLGRAGMARLHRRARKEIMRIRAAVLNQMGAAKPYAKSKPLSVEQVKLDEPGYGEVLIRIAAAGLCHSDLSVINGDRPRPVPMVLGHEAAGESSKDRPRRRTI